MGHRDDISSLLNAVLMEKILRVQPSVKHLYILIRAQDARSAKKRVKEEILGSNLFRFLQARHGDEYEACMEQKVTGVVGDVRKEKLGMDPSVSTLLAAEIDIIVHCAGSTSFDER